MAIKTFSDGAVLTSSDANTYLANAGLDYITETTVTGTTQNAVNLNSCFSAIYDSYRVIIHSSSHVSMRFRAGTSDNTAANYYYSYMYINYDGGIKSSVMQSGVTSVDLGSYPSFGGGNVAATIDIFNPQKSVATSYTCQSFDGYGFFLSSGNGCVFSSGHHSAATSFDGFTLSADFASPTTYLAQNMIIRVYGFRQS